MKQGVIVLIPKPGKNPKTIDSLRPITLLNNDYKLLAHIYTSLLKEGLSQVVSDTQSGFLNGRSIHNNIRLTLDVLDYNELIEDKGCILFLDFKKAFDTLEHPFMIHTLKAFGFGDCFIKVIECFYKDVNSCVSLPHGTSPRFDVQNGIRQGCPASPGLFILAAEMLTIMIKNCEMLKKLNVFGTELAISQFADDTTLLLKDEHQIPIAIQNIEIFSRASGLFLNIEKCELLSIHENAQNVICNIPVKTGKISWCLCNKKPK